MFKRILVGVDLAACHPMEDSAPQVLNQEAIRCGVQLAQDSAAMLHFLSVCNLGDDDLHPMDAEDRSLIIRSAVAKADKLLNQLVYQAKQEKVAGNWRFSVGKAWLEIIREVLRTQPDLLVVGTRERLALLDMDGTLLRGRFIVNLAKRTNRTSDLAEFLDNHNIPPEERTRHIAALFAGVPREVFEETARSMPLMQGAVETVVSLRKAGYRVGIVTDSFRLASEVVRRRVFADFSIAHLMKFRHGKATGDVTLSPAMVHARGCLKHPSCKVNVMYHLLEKMDLHADQVLAVGDGDNDCFARRVRRLPSNPNPPLSRAPPMVSSLVP